MAYDCDFPGQSATIIRNVNVVSGAQPSATGTAVHNLTIADTATGTMDYYVFGVQHASSTSFPTWTDANGQDDLVWYAGQNLGAGTWKGTVNLAAHTAVGGANVNVYVHNPVHTVGAPGLRLTRDASGWPPVIPGATPTGVDAGPHNFNITATQGTIDLYVWGVYNATQVHIPTWSAVNGQDDLLWYPAVNLGKGTWKATINLGNHAHTGLFEAAVWVTNTTGGTINNWVKNIHFVRN